MNKSEFVQNVLRDTKWIAERAWDEYQYHKEYAKTKGPVWSHRELWVPGSPEGQLETIVHIQIQNKTEIVENVTMRTGEYKDEPS